MEGDAEPPIFCVVASTVSTELLARLKDHLGERGIEVVAESRSEERRSGERRERLRLSTSEDERRRTFAAGRRSDRDRRGAVLLSEHPSLPTWAAPLAQELSFAARAGRGDRREQGLITRARAGDQGAFDRLYARNYERTCAVVESIVRDRHEAEDIAQQAFVEVLLGLADYELRDRPFSSWLHTIARNRAVDWLRRSQRQIPIPRGELEARLETEAFAEPPHVALVTRERVRSLLYPLPEAQRRVVFLRSVMELRAGEVAAAGGESEQGVRARHARAMRGLRGRVAEPDVEPA